MFEKLKRIYAQYDLMYINSKVESESKDYGACEFKINGLNVKFRVAKITPIKSGQFVTFWKRDLSGTIIPFDVKDSFDMFIVVVAKDDFFGHFLFPKSVLYAKGVISKNGIGGKRALRVYPFWDTVSSKHAKRTQQWQLPYFCQLDSNDSENETKIRNILSMI